MRLCGLTALCSSLSLRGVLVSSLEGIQISQASVRHVFFESVDLLCQGIGRTRTLRILSNVFDLLQEMQLPGLSVGTRRLEEVLQERIHFSMLYVTRYWFSSWSQNMLLKVLA